MSSFKDWKLGTKLFALIGFMVLAMAGPGLYNIRATDQVANSGSDMFKYNLLGVEYALTAKAAYLQMAAGLRDYILASNAQEFETADKTITAKQQELE